MKYIVRINKKLRYLRTYTIVKRVDRNDNFLTRMFIKVFSRKGGENANTA
jgi:hypothetical protein